MSGVGRASAVIAAGTIASRLTGFVRSIVMVAALGGAIAPAGNAFAVANQLPNNVFAIISYGILTAVIVPQIVKSAAHRDGGDAFVSKLLTLGAVVLLAVTLVTTVAAPLLVELYAPQFPPDQVALATAFAYWCLPQIFFYGMYSLLGETLNARAVYGPFTWSPIVNNLVSIAGFVVFIVLFGTERPLTAWTTEAIALLAGTATAGIAVQAVLLVFFWRRAKLRVRPDFRWRGMGLGNIGRLAGWTFLMVIAGQLAGIVQSRVMPPAGSAGVLASQNAWLLFMLPYSIVVISIGTPYFTRLSQHAAAGDTAAVRRDVSLSIRTLAIFIVPAVAALAVAAVPASRMFTKDAVEATLSAEVLWCYLVGLLPLAVLFVIQRTFYAYDDTRTPFAFTMLQCGLVVATAIAAGLLLPPEQVAAGVALGQSLASTVQVIIAIWLLHRRVGHIRIAEWTRTIVRLTVAALPAAAAGWGVYVLLGGAVGWTSSSILAGGIGAAIVGLIVVAVYLGILLALKSPELAPAEGVLRRFRRRPPA